jgi:hypothetical protein
MKPYTIPILIIPATWEAKVETSQSKASPGEASKRPFLKNKLKAK